MTRASLNRTIATGALTLIFLAGCHEGSEIGDPNSGEPEEVTENVEVGSATQSVAQDLIGTLETRPDYSTLVSAIQAAGLADRLNGDEPVTLFAPDNEAFEKLPATKLEQLIAMADGPELRRLLSLHVVPEALGRAAIERAITEGDGSAEYGTLGGETLTITKQGDNLIITAESGSKATIKTADIKASNGIVHGINRVLEPVAPKEEDDEALADNDA